MTLGSWYSGGVDAFAYAAKMLGIETVYHIENNRDLWKYLNKNYGKKRIYGHDTFVDIPYTDIIAGGDPCQPSSSAGLRRGQADDRYRWPYMLAGISRVRPNWVVNENVVGSISNMVLDQKISDLEKIGYTCQAYNIPAVATGAHHQRARVFLVAHSDVQGRRELLCHDPAAGFKQGREAYTLGAQGNAFDQFRERFGQSAILPMAHGIPDHILRLGAIGNSIVSTIPLILLEAILYIQNNSH